jgi:hypothetical protein
VNSPQDEPPAQPRLTPEYVEAILDRIRDYALCSDLRMYTWERRRRHQDAGSEPEVVDYMRSIERSTVEFAEDAFEGLREFLLELTTEHPPTATEREEPIPDSLREHLDRTDAAVARAGLSDDVLSTMAAVGAVVSWWRNTLEPWHKLFTDAQMSWMSLTATRDIAPYMDPASNRPDFAAIEQVLCDPDRLVLPDAPAHDALGPAWPAIARRVAGNVKQHPECRLHGPRARQLGRHCRSPLVGTPGLG